jgi:dihydroorotate dehydrogenase electron transfer subunit
MTTKEMNSQAEPAQATRDHSTKIVALRKVCRDVFRVTLECPGLARAIEPGQFLQVEVAPGTFPVTRRPFTISDIDVDAGTLDILFRVVGRGTALLAEFSVGSLLRVMGPLGNGYLIPEGQGRRWLLIAGGMGAAGFPLLAGSLEGGTCLLGVSTVEEASMLDPTILPDSFDLRLSSEDGTCGAAGLVTCLLEGVDYVIYDGIAVCGPVAMLRAVSAALPPEVVERTQISTEARMACGWGGCEGCAIPTSDGGFRRCCTEGPVFAATEIDWARWGSEEEVGS